MVQVDGPLGLHRPTLLEILQSKLSTDCKIHTSKRLERYEVADDGSVSLIFSDGSRGVADVLVGADGVHSATRGSMFASLGDGYEQYIRATFSGTIAYRGALSKAKFAEAFPNHRALDHPKLVRFSLTTQFPAAYNKRDSGVERTWWASICVVFVQYIFIILI